MERELKKFSVVFGFGNSEIYTIYSATSEREAFEEIREELLINDEIGALAEFDGHLINPKLLQSVEIRNLPKPEEEYDTI